MRRGKHGLAADVQFKVIASLVHQPMMVTAQQEQVVEPGLAAVGPVADVVRIDMMAGRAAGKAAAAVAPVECAADGRRNTAAAAADIQRACLKVAAAVFQPVHHAAVTGQPAGRFC